MAAKHSTKNENKKQQQQQNPKKVRTCKGAAIAGLVVPHGLRNAEEEKANADAGREHHHEPRRVWVLCRQKYKTLMR
jgi:hypothetical protein